MILPPIYQAQYAALTDEWQDFAALKPHGEWLRFDDLAQMGYAETKTEPIMRGSRVIGQRFYFRLKQNN